MLRPQDRSCPPQRRPRRPCCPYCPRICPRRSWFARPHSHRLPRHRSLHRCRCSWRRLTACGLCRCSAPRRSCTGQNPAMRMRRRRRWSARAHSPRLPCHRSFHRCRCRWHRLPPARRQRSCQRAPQPRPGMRCCQSLRRRRCRSWSQHLRNPSSVALSQFSSTPLQLSSGAPGCTAESLSLQSKPVLLSA